MIKIPFLGRGGESIQRISIEGEKNEIKRQIEKNVAEKDRPILYEIFGIIEQLTDNPHHQIELLSKLRSIVIIYGDGWELESFKKELLELQERRNFLGKLKWALIAFFGGSVAGYFLGSREKSQIKTTPTPSPSPTETPTPSPAPTPPPTKTPTQTATQTSTPEATPTPEPTPTPEGFISRERIKEWADGAVERIINEIERQNPGVKIKGFKLELAILDEVENHMVYKYSIIWDGKETITINKNEMEKRGISVKSVYTILIEDVYSGETGKGVVFSFKSSNPLIYYMRLIGYWPDYKTDEFSVFQETEKEKGRPVLYLEIRVDPKNPKVNPPFSTTSPEKNLPPEK
jgi:hypothetical protein